MVLAAEETRVEEECPPSPSGYVFYPGQDSSGGDLEQRSGTVEELAAQCNENVQVGRLVLPTRSASAAGQKCLHLACDCE